MGNAEKRMKKSKIALFICFLFWLCQAQWLILLIPATWESDMGGLWSDVGPVKKCEIRVFGLSGRSLV
jgi:hypothetical protein